jgi:hypothetical protein
MAALGTKNRMGDEMDEFVEINGTRVEMAELAASVMSELLDRESCAPDDNFFLLGGDSLLAVTAARRLSQKAGRPVAAQDIFLNPTPGELGAFLRTTPVAAHQR